MKVGYVINPVAGNKKAIERIAPIKKATRERGFEDFFYITEQPGDALSRGQQAVAEGCQVVVAVGGDGTVNELVNGLRESDVTMGVIPAGSGNDFARTMGIPLDFMAALDCVLNGNTRSIDIGTVNDTSFINVASVGFDAQVVMETQSIKKRIPGSLAYMLGVFKALTDYEPYEIELKTESETIRRRVTLVALANGVYYGGGMKIAPEAVVDDGFLEVYVVEEMSRLKILGLFPLIYSGRHTARPEVRRFKASEARINCSNGYINSDGEIVGRCPARFSIVPSAVRVIVPQE